MGFAAMRSCLKVSLFIPFHLPRNSTNTFSATDTNIADSIDEEGIDQEAYSCLA